MIFYISIYEGDSRIQVKTESKKAYLGPGYICIRYLGEDFDVHHDVKRFSSISDSSTGVLGHSRHSRRDGILGVVAKFLIDHRLQRS
jgi:hypothetical protein